MEWPSELGSVRWARPDPSPTGAQEGRVQPAGRARTGSGAVMSDPLVGRLLDGRYRIGARIARGGMASVYEADDPRLDRQCAVKVMHPGLGDDEEFAARFVREARSAARLDHPNVVAVFDQGDDDGHGVPGDGVRRRAHAARRHPQGAPDAARAGAGAGRAGPLGAGAAPTGPAWSTATSSPRTSSSPTTAASRSPTSVWPRPSAPTPSTPHRRGADRHRLLPRARAGRRRPLRRPRRRLRRGRGALRAAHRQQAPRGRVDRSRWPTSTCTRTCRRRRGSRPACRRTSTPWSPAPPPATSTSGRPTRACCCTSSTGSRRPFATASARTPS